jgi:hypothetical protein
LQPSPKEYNSHLPVSFQAACCCGLAHNLTLGESIMNLQRGKQLRSLLANLQVIAGSLLLLGAVAHALLIGFTMPVFSSSALWSIFCEMFPISGGVAPAPTPEIDSGSAGTAIALLIGGLLLLGGLRTKRQARTE